MTTPTQAAQAADPDFVTTELCGIIDVCEGSPTAIVSVERMRLWLSKLRAPVVDEPVQHPKREDVTPEMRAGFERLFSEARKRHHGTLARNEQGAYRNLWVAADWVFYQRAWADALASAPVADERALHIKALQDLRLGVEMDQHYMDDGDAKLAALDAAITALRWSAGALQALNIEADKITLDGETRTVGDILDHADRALASAPVALSGVERQAVTGLITVARAAFTFCDDALAQFEQLGEALDLLDELPDDQPGYSMGPSNRAEWALRRLLGVASAPVAGEAQPVAWMVYASDTHQLKRIVTTDPGDTASFGCLKLPLYAAPQASAEALDTLTIDLDYADGASVQIEVHGTEKMLRRLETWLGGERSRIREQARNAALEEAAAAMDDHCRAGREWIPGSLWDALSREAGARIRALKAAPAPTAAEGSEDDMLTIAYLAGAQAEKERAALSAQPGVIRNPLIAEPSGNPGELDCAALAARKEGDGNAN
ncbi:Uncharacterised protein [Bordetella bronchiseptica]|uniref:hypothetical protein n=1 Tax=Bordetella bronchiseptica TaxID=518 RepID=UPI000E128382|nr:hypothetical protein [Bordetella bronchiseptica]SUW10769.1 Uncharacterised protein [Bordetella bronchiseptica]